jgi:hemerythrin-like domain-containing protein
MMDLFEMAPTFDDPLGMLHACHRRIERALDALALLARREQEATLEVEARETLRRVLHYFATGVPRHARDEEESLFPRLRDAVERQKPEARHALDTLEEEHAVVDAVHRELETPSDDLLRAGRFERPEGRARLSTLIASLRELYEEHIHMEDERIFPLAAEVLDAGGQEAIGTEIATRRGMDWEQQREFVQ